MRLALWVAETDTTHATRSSPPIRTLQVILTNPAHKGSGMVIKAKELADEHGWFLPQQVPQQPPLQLPIDFNEDLI